MWYGKLAIIMTLFSFSLSWGLYEMSTVITAPPGGNLSWQQQHIKDMAGNYTSISNLNNGQDPNPALIFGDFITGLTVLLNALAVVGNSLLGGGLVSVLQGITGIDQNIMWLIQIIYGSSEALLWVYVVSNRSL